MIHEELLVKVKDIPTTKAVVKLHKPIAVLTGDGTGTIYYNRSKLQCENCHGQYAKDIGIYPCPTIEAIQEQLK